MNTATYRKTQQGEWVIVGSIDIVKVGEVTVTKKSGETKVETVVRVGKTFTTDAGECCYGYTSTTLESTERALRNGDESFVSKAASDAFYAEADRRLAAGEVKVVTGWKNFR